MKVADVMHRTVFSVSEDTPIKEVARLIFSLGVAGIPVVKDKKLIGIVTEQDILSKMYPSIEELIEDYIHVRDFVEMEKRITDLLDRSVKEIMNTSVTTTSPEIPLMEAQSIMLTNRFSHLPIIDKNRNLIGIISQGDIFRQLLKDEIPRLEKERYAVFIGRYYDMMVNWEKRLGYEFPILFNLFKKYNIHSVLDLGVWTGEYTINLAKKGLNRGINKILGLDHNSVMIEMCEKKKEKLPADIRKNIKFMLTSFKNLSKNIPDKYDVAICMGNALPYIPLDVANLFKEVSSMLREKNGLLVLQILNFDKIIKTKKRLLNFTIQKSKEDEHKEHLAMEFFDMVEDGCVLHHVVVFDSDGKNWIYKGTTTIPICYPSKDEIEKALKEAGFNNISFSGSMGEYQGEYGELSFTEPFKPSESDWLNVIATR